MKKLYCISGLGADGRIFSKLRIEGASLQNINWIQPFRDEEIHHYAARLSSQVEDDNAILMGLSFGGMMAIEIARILGLRKVILISSIKQHSELPFWLRTCGRYGLDQILPNKSLTNYPITRAFRPIQNYFLGAKTAEEKRLANEYRDKVDPLYLKWSIHQVVCWQNNWLPPDVVHIHGDKDHIFPLKYVKPTHVIPAGGHFMVMNHHSEISKIISETL